MSFMYSGTFYSEAASQGLLGRVPGFSLRMFSSPTFRPLLTPDLLEKKKSQSVLPPWASCTTFFSLSLFIPPIGNRQLHRPLLRLQQRQLHRAAHRQPGHRSGSRRVLLQRHQPVRQPRGEVRAPGAQPPGPPVAPPRGSG